MITYIPPENEGRVDRSVRELSKENEIVIVTCNSKEKYYGKAEIRSVNARGGNIKRYLEYFVKATWGIVTKREEYELIYAHNFYSALIALVLLMFHSSNKLIYDAYELLIPAGGKKFSLRDYFFYYAEKKAIKKADKVVCANDIRGYIMLGHYNLKNKPITIQNVLEKGKRQKKNRVLDNRTTVKIVYAGYIDANRKIDQIIKAVDYLGSRFKLVIAGDGPEIDKLKVLAKELNMTNIEFKGKYTREELIEILAYCHIGYLSYPEEGLNNIYCAPNKISEYAVAGIPMISNQNSGVAYYIKEYGIGVETQHLAQGILKITKNYDIYCANLDKYLNENNWEKEAQKLLEIVREI